ncbi:MAG: glycosyltransferase family 4 protein [Thermoplasmatota archaeon]
MAGPVRIALLGSGMLPVPPEGYGAVETHVHELGLALRRRGHDVTTVASVFGRGPWNEYRFARWALRETRRIHPDIVHAHTTGVGATFAAARRTFVYTSHSRHWATAEGLRERVGFRLERYVVPRASRTIALTPDVAKRMKETTGTNATVIPNGVDPNRFQPAWEKRSGKRALAVGVVAPHKAQLLAAKAATEAGWSLTVAGPIVDAAYAQSIRDAGATVTGPVSIDQLVALYAEADAFIHMSQSEALSLAVLEAMASALPIVASEVCVGQVMAGVTGFPIAITDKADERVAAAAQALRALRDENLRRSLGEGARKMAIETYSWDSVAAAVEGVYRGLLS